MQMHACVLYDVPGRSCPSPPRGPRSRRSSTRGSCSGWPGPGGTPAGCFRKGVWWLNGRGQWSINEGRTRRQQRQGAHNQTKAQPPLDGGSHISTRQQRGSHTIQPQAHVCTYVAGLAVADADGIGLLVELEGGRVRLHVVQDAHLPVGFRGGCGRGCGAVCQWCGSWRSSGWLVHQAAIPDVLASHNNGRREDTQKTQARTARRSGSSPGT